MSTIEIPMELIKLVEKFERNREAYMSGTYNETQGRREFIDPLFELLGWDISNKQGLTEAYKEVVHEDAIKIGGAHKAPDYGFRIGGVRRFFVEAKKPAVNVRDSAPPAFQLRRYAWSAKLPVSVLTDFEEFAIYDCRIVPNQLDKPSTARTFICSYTEYPSRWSEIAGLFSKEAVLDGSLDAYASAAQTNRGSATVDMVFLREIESWRASLARDLAIHNPNLTSRQLNYAVQMTIDRIVFLRMTEDRGIEEYGRLLALTNGGHIYERLRDLYRQADERYNSGLFHFQQERARAEQPDVLSPTLVISDEPLRRIFQNLYFPDSPYEFSVLPVEVLGQVYEQFLGKTIDISPAREISIEEKPEVRKAGGVYYTPKYIVDYIVSSSIGPLLSDKKPGPRGGVSKLRILDPACGSGSFLIGAFEFLLDWHRDRYFENGPENHRKEIYQGAGGRWLLTTPEKKRILLSNIYGVDIDPQAVEVTKLSLLLKVLEGESDQTIRSQLRMFHERALPDLDSNIKCGNSLIGPDFFDNQQLSLFDEEDHFRLNVFDWAQAFPEVFSRSAPGFDAVIGNPPYRRELDYKHLMDEIASTSFGKKYRSPRMDLWYYFVHRGLELLRQTGTLSFIVNSYWTAGTGASKLITALRESAHVREIFTLGSLKVFENVSGQHMMLRVGANTSNEPTVVKRVQPTTEVTAQPFVTGTAVVETYFKSPDQLFRNGKIDLLPPNDDLLSTIERGTPLSSLGLIRQGIAENPAAINRKTNLRFGQKWTVGEGVFALTQDEVTRMSLSPEEEKLLRPYYDLKDLNRYFISESPSLWLIYATRSTCPDIARFPSIFAHLSRFREIMEARRETREGSNSWWHLHWPREERLWESPKIVSMQMGVRPSFVSASKQVYVPFSTNVFVPYPSTGEHINYVLGLLNSDLLWRWFDHNAKRRGVGLEINGNVLSRAPIRRIDFSIPAEKSQHDKLVALVDEIMDRRKRLDGVKTAHETTVVGQQIDAIDRQIDTLVRALYGVAPSQLDDVGDA